MERNIIEKRLKETKSDEGYGLIHCVIFFDVLQNVVRCPIYT